MKKSKKNEISIYVMIVSGHQRYFSADNRTIAINDKVKRGMYKF